jgi:hypothetical protein
MSSTENNQVFFSSFQTARTSRSSKKRMEILVMGNGIREWTGLTEWSAKEKPR